MMLPLMQERVNESRFFAFMALTMYSNVRLLPA